jgi:acyl-CoA thioesterase
MDAATLARACADAMWADDAASRALGIQLISVEPGHAMLGMAVSATMVNWHNTCHGGFVYLLADTAFGYACNTRNQRMVRSIAASAISIRRGWATC